MQNTNHKGNTVIYIMLAVIMAMLLVVMFLLLGKTPSTSSKPVEPRSVTCDYNGKTYAVGQGFTADDDCNSCSCGEDGQVSCTLMVCTPVENGVLERGVESSQE